MGVCGWARVSAAPLHSWLGCQGLCLLLCALRLHPATPGLGVRCGCVCFGSGFGCAPPLLAGVLGCVCVLMCLLCLYPATPGWGVPRGCVCLGSGFGCAPPLLAGVLGCVYVCGLAPLVPRHSWLGCVVPTWVPWLGLRLRPATPKWAVGVRVCLCARSACTPPLLAGVVGCVCAVVGALPLPRHCWLGCAVWVCAFGLGLRLRPASSGWGVVVCVFVCVLPLYSATAGWGVRRWCLCWGSGFGCAPPFLAGVLGCVCAGVGAPPVPCHSWPGCAVWVCVFALGSQLRPATPGWGVGVCVFVCVLPL